MKWLSPVLILSMMCAACLEPSGDAMNKLPRLPGARLLVGYPPGILVVTSPDNTWTVADTDVYLGVFPTMSGDGNVIATTRLKSPQPIRDQQPMSIATYSLVEGKWTEYREIPRFQGGIAISHDGYKLAFAVADPRRRPPVEMHVVDLNSEAERRYPIEGHLDRIGVSWSPDGRYLVYDTYPQSPYDTSDILVLDLETGASRKIATGYRPAWSPSGEWIAYYYLPEATRQHLMLVRPDGTGARRLHKDKYLMTPPVWSPDSTRIILSAGRDYMTGTVDVKVVNIATRKVTRLVKGGPPVFGWAEAK